jgi:hypothetical protein
VKRAEEQTADGGIAQPLEAVQAQRVLGDIAAQDGDPVQMRDHYEQALQLSQQFGSANRYVRDEAVHFTRAYYALSALQLAALERGHCAIAAEVWSRFGDEVTNLRGTYEVVRRGSRVAGDVCGLGLDATLGKLRASWQALVSR